MAVSSFVQSTCDVTELVSHDDSVLLKQMVTIRLHSTLTVRPTYFIPSLLKIC